MSNQNIVRIYYTFSVCILIAITAISCKKDQYKDCPCESTRLIIGPGPAFITDSGAISFNTTPWQNKFYFKDKFVIIKNQGGITTRYVICDESTLPASVLDLRKDPSQSIPVFFNGIPLDACEQLSDSPDRLTIRTKILTLKIQ